ncbi:hypothetical protein GMRT_21994 [Giardia muris]|uniref:Uncharacterized protein n=1 Tax=Giardia muris TaxID=5742 RepID=A0A4Z1T791_GIAMU|nr:hypothetical protein GMRT_21984 [Giardia muris]TNJ28361.1 hypothetical protein GMRT_21994 [Giardia muris]|eukprot:TNJ28351.1 hypothetical protein GMRT_21984 [Giardia muris]
MTPPFQLSELDTAQEGVPTAPSRPLRLAHSTEEQTFRQGMLLAVCVGAKEHHSDRSVRPLTPDSSQGSRECTGKEGESSLLSQEASLRSHSFVVEDHPVGPPASCPTGQGGQIAVL